MPNQYNHKVELIEEVSLKAAIKAVGKPYRNKKANEKLLHNVIVVRKHESIAEHITFKFDITGISRAVLQELARHRIGSFTVESSRFCLEKILKEYKEDATKVFTEDNVEDDEVMLKTVKEMTAKYVNLNLEGKDERLQCMMLGAIHLILNTLVNLSEEGLSNDDLKPFLPEGFRTTLVWTINLRALNNFLQLRTDKHAFIEMRMFAEEVQKLAKSTSAGFLVYPTSTE